MSIRFSPNRAFNPKKIAGIRANMEEAARAIGDDATSIANQVSPSYETRIEDGDQDRIRVVAQSNGIDAAGWIEFGTAKLPALAPLRRGAELNGLDLRAE